MILNRLKFFGRLLRRSNRSYLIISVFSKKVKKSSKKC
nr:MAG TPA: hypothetical protein [Caudoviricetes sp.]